MIDSDNVLQIANAVVLAEVGRPLSDLERHVLQCSLVGQSYDDMAEGWSARTIRDAGFRLWRLFSQALGEDIKVNKSNFQAAIMQLAQNPAYQVQDTNLSPRTVETMRFPSFKTFKLSKAQSPSSPAKAGSDSVASSTGAPQTSPFIVGPPIAHPRNFFGRERVLKRLFRLLNSHPLQNAAIVGPRRSGKTSLLNYLRTITTAQQLRDGQKSDWIPNPERYRWIFVDFQDARMTQRDRLLNHILESLDLPISDSCDLSQFLDRISHNINTPTVILMDEIDVGLQRCPELDDCFWESLRSLATNQSNGNLAFVLATSDRPAVLASQTGHSSPFFNIFGYTTILTPFTEQEARDLIASSPIPFSEEDIDWILEKSGQWPFLLQILCQEHLFSLEEKQASQDWKEEGLAQLFPFRYLLEASKI